MLLDRVGQSRIYTPYMTVYLVISLPKIPYVNRIYMVLANPAFEPSSQKWEGLAAGAPARTKSDRFPNSVCVCVLVVVVVVVVVVGRGEAGAL